MKSVNRCLILSLSAVLIAAANAAPLIDGCPNQPANNIWNTPIEAAPVHSNSAQYISTIGSTVGLHPDFGTVYQGAPIGIPYVIVPGSQPKISVTFEFADESDPGPYPIPPNPPIEGGPSSTGDRHILMVDKDNCKLYELYSAYPNANGTWRAGSGAIYDLRSNALRPDTWTSADAAGLPVLPGLVRYDEVLAGEINHAIRFTAVQTKREYVWPARHFASSRTGAQFPPMGQRFRLKAGVDISRYSPQVQVILRAFKKYGIILADNGSNWYISGAPDSRWNDEVLAELSRVKGADFEAIDVSALKISANSGEAKQACANVTLDSDSDGIPDCTEPTVGRNPLVKDNDVFANNQLFIMQQYRDFLTREADSTGLNYWGGEFTSGRQNRATMVKSSFDSNEFQGTISPLVRLYIAYLQRDPDYAGLQFQIGQRKGGRSLAQISQDFAQSPEFQAQYGALDNQQFVARVYQNVLGRVGDAAGVAFFKSQLDTGALTRGQMMLTFSESNEFQAQVNSRVYVVMIYAGMLRRESDLAGRNFWIDVVNRGQAPLDIINSFLVAPEYRARFL